MKTRGLIFSLIEHTDGVTSVAMAASADGVRTFSAGEDATVISWDLEKAQPGHVMRSHTGVVRGVAIAQAAGSRFLQGPTAHS